MGIEESCVVCLQQECEVLFEPCGHEVVCRGCLSFLDKPECVLCRAQVGNVRIGADSMRWGEALEGRLAEEARMLQEVCQVVVLGPGHVNTKTLVREICSAYRMEWSTKILRRKWARAHRISDDNFVVGENWNSRFVHNASIRGMKYRFSSLQVETIPTRSQVRQIMENLAPGLIILCCDYHDPESFTNLVKWDNVLSSFRNIPRIWTIQVNARAAESSVVLNVDASVSDAMGRLVRADRTAAFSVEQVCVDSWNKVGQSDLIRSVVRATTNTDDSSRKSYVIPGRRSLRNLPRVRLPTMTTEQTSTASCTA